MLAGGGEVHSVTSLDQAVEVLKAINYPVGTLYFIHSLDGKGRPAIQSQREDD